MAAVTSQNLVHQKSNILIRALIGVSARPDLQTVGLAPQERSADDCHALVGDHQIPVAPENLITI
jgi:hypothetical protein